MPTARALMTSFAGKSGMRYSPAMPSTAPMHPQITGISSSFTEPAALQPMPTRYAITVIAATLDTKDLTGLYGSKYVFSDCKVYPNVKEKLGEGRTVLFSGTPCQVGGLKAYLKKDYDNLYTIDNICHGAPSQKVWKEYLTELTQGR